MRNLMMYPVTKEEKLKYIDDLLSDLGEMAPGDMEGVILAEIRKDVEQS